MINNRTYKVWGFLLLCLLFISCKKDNSNNRVQNNYEEISPSSWMSQLIAEFPDQEITMRKIMIPAAHDAGMYILKNCSLGANACNTKTQSQDFEAMLMQGMRAFDVRPSFAGGKFFTEHSTGCGGLGCKGDLLSNIYSDINNFLENHQELVILEISHYCNTGLEDNNLLDLATNIFGDKIFKNLPMTTSMIHMPIKEIIGNSGKGKVLLIYEGADNSFANRALGIFSPLVLPKEGAWTNSPNLSQMLENQLKLYEEYTNNDHTLFQFNWQITKSTLSAVNCAINPASIPISKSADSANNQIIPVLDSLITSGKLTKGRIPNLFYFDFCSKEYAEKCIGISRLNLK